MYCMIIKLTPHGDNLTIVTNAEGAVTIDTNIATTEIVEAFIGPILYTSDGETLGVCMRDSGFHLQYIVDGVTTDVILNEGEVTVPSAHGSAGVWEALTDVERGDVINLISEAVGPRRHLIDQGDAGQRVIAPSYRALVERFESTIAKLKASVGR